MSRARDRNSRGLVSVDRLKLLSVNALTTIKQSGRNPAIAGCETYRENPVYRSNPAISSAALVLAAVAAPLSLASAQQSDLTVSPFVSYLPAMGGNPLAGLALTLAGDAGLGVRASGNISLQNQNAGTVGFSNSVRPWGVDADAILSVGGRRSGGSRRSVAPFVFVGVGAASNDTAGYRMTATNWSYGAGASLPVANSVDLFGESRWRMSRYVLPTASMAPSPTAELRFGVSFHVGKTRSRRSSSMASRADALPPLIVTAGRAGSETPTVAVARILNTADDYLGAPYRYGGTSPNGFDCSGFVQYVFARNGVTLPRTSRQQAQVGQSLTPDWRAVAAGDLVMFADNGPISHVAIYAGNNRIIHSSSSGGGVRYDDLSTTRGSWFVDHMVAARRVTPDARGLLLDLGRGFAEFGIPLDGPDRAPKAR
jgi:peptidoglycan DL-endopeptidase CwlO